MESVLTLIGSFRQRHLGALLRLRPPAGQHTPAEADALARYAKGCKSAVEIGVAEGVSAAVVRSAMDPAGRLWLVDPYLSKYPISAAHLVARRTVGAATGDAVEWVRSLSHEAAETWNQPLDFVFIDGDHSEEACLQDWLDWSPWVRPGGVVIFHDSATGPGSQARPDWGPVLVVDALFRRAETMIAGWSLVEETDSITVVQRSATGSR